MSILDKYRTPEFLAQMARNMAQYAKENIQTSTNLDGSPMTTNKRNGKPLIRSGAMVASIKAIGNKCVVDVPYAADVQKATGNQFIGRPPGPVWAKWLKEYLAQVPNPNTTTRPPRR